MPGFRNSRRSGFRLERLERRDCPAALSISPATITERSDQGFSSMAFTVTLSQASRSVVSVEYSASAQTALLDSDFNMAAGRLFFTPGQTTKTITASIRNDVLREGTETFLVSLRNPSNATLGNSSAVGRILDDDSYKLSIAPQTAVNAGNTALFTLTLSAPATKTEMVRFQVMDGTAHRNIDYTVSTDSYVALSRGQTSAVFSIPTKTTTHSAFPKQFTVTVTPSDVALSRPLTTAVVINPPAPPPPASNFQITLDYVTSAQGPVSQAIKDACVWAADRWSKVIVGDLPNTTLANGTPVDDIVIHVQAGLLGGAPNAAGGTLANAGPIAFRADSGLPYEAAAGIDPFDANNPQLRNIILHEFGHALGFGSLWIEKNLVRNAGPGAFTNDPTYVGTNAVREYNKIFGTIGTSMPVENGIPPGQPGDGTYGAHWRESVMVTELMTGYSEQAGVRMPLSTITVGAMRDLGYQVNYAAADIYARPAGGVAPASRQPLPGGAAGGGFSRLAARETYFSTYAAATLFDPTDRRKSLMAKISCFSS